MIFLFSHASPLSPFGPNVLTGPPTELLISAFLVSVLIVQYWFLFTLSTTITPSQWSTLTPRFIYSNLQNCSTDIPPISLQEDLLLHPTCALEGHMLDIFFDTMGIWMPRSERMQLIQSLDQDGDGKLRWVEIAAAHSFPTDATGVDVWGGTNNETSMWELRYLVEVWRRTKDVMSVYGERDGRQLLRRMKILQGGINGLDKNLQSYYF